MSIFAGDVIIKTAIEQGLEDIRKNLWLIDDILSHFIEIDILREKYGQKEIDAAKDWFSNNRIEVFMQYRNDKDKFPCIVVGMGSSSEKEGMKHLGDLSSCVETLVPNKIGKPVPYVVKPFVPVGYNQAEGEVATPDTVDLTNIAPGMILVNPDTGYGYPILGISENGILIEQGLVIEATRFAVVPKNQFYKVRREHTFFQETYNIGCHTHGDPAPLLWLHAITMYLLLRYRESLLEGRYFAESSISASELTVNGELSTPGGELVYSRYITLSGQVENSWLKTPKRVIEVAKLASEPNKEKGYRGGIKIISQEAPEFLNSEDEGWTTIDE
jgi:hypothetical protein